MNIKNSPKFAYLLKIDYNKTQCPVCKNVGGYEKNDYELICGHCGFVIDTPYQYTAGFKFNQNLTFALKKIQRADKK